MDDMNVPIPNGPLPEDKEKHSETAGTAETMKNKFCKFCGSKIPSDAVVCTSCGRQVEELKGGGSSSQPIIINNTNTNTNNNNNNTGGYVNPKNKWVALILCFFFGYLGIHKFYEGKILLGIIYLLTLGICGFGVFVDFIILLFKPNPYY